MKVFEYVIVHQPNGKKKKPYIVGDEIFLVFAQDRDQVILEAGLTVKDFDVPLDEVEIIVRPFVG